jgi:hypothetical protein
MTSWHSSRLVLASCGHPNGVYPTNHQQHETLELTEGINSWSEIGFYVFTSERDGHGVQWVGDHIRPRVRVPDSWHWPIGLGLSTEVGYQRAVYSPDTWTWEIRPIIDKTAGRWYFAVNPALERTWHGPDVRQGLGFSPAAKISYDFTRSAMTRSLVDPKWNSSIQGIRHWLERFAQPILKSNTQLTRKVPEMSSALLNLSDLKHAVAGECGFPRCR